MELSNLFQITFPKKVLTNVKQGLLNWTAQGTGVKQYGEIRQPYPSENTYFSNNTHVAGMAADDNKIVLNPYSSNTPAQQQQVAKNEGVRLYLRDNPNSLSNFKLTDQQKKNFKGYSSDINDIRSTIMARAITGDRSAGNLTMEQAVNALRIRQSINRGVKKWQK